MRAPRSRPTVAVGHVVLHASSVPASARFYEVLGCRPVYASTAMAILELRGGTHLMLFAGKPRLRDGPGFDLMVDELAAHCDQLRAAGIDCTGIEVDERSEHELFTCNDPDGYRIIVFSDHTEGRPV